MNLAEMFFTILDYVVEPEENDAEAPELDEDDEAEEGEDDDDGQVEEEEPREQAE